MLIYSSLKFPFLPPRLPWASTYQVLLLPFWELFLCLSRHLFFPLDPLRASFPHDSLPNSLLFLQTLCHHIFTASAISSEWVWFPYLSLKLQLVFLPAGHLCLNFLMSSATLVLATRIYFPKPVLHHVFPSFIAPTLSLPKIPIIQSFLTPFSPLAFKFGLHISIDSISQKYLKPIPLPFPLPQLLSLNLILLPQIIKITSLHISLLLYILISSTNIYWISKQRAGCWVYMYLISRTCSSVEKTDIQKGNKHTEISVFSCIY